MRTQASQMTQPIVAMAMDGRRGLFPTGLGIGRLAWQGSQMDASGWRKCANEQTLEIPRDCSACAQPIRSARGGSG
jgi:hypothetical protein